MSNENPTNKKLKIVRGLNWVKSRLNRHDWEIFDRIASQVHPKTGKTRLAAMVYGLAEEGGTEFLTYRMGAKTYMLGSTAYDARARRWFADSQWLMQTIGNVAKSNGGVVVVKPGPYLWIGRKQQD